MADGVSVPVIRKHDRNGLGVGSCWSRSAWPRARGCAEDWKKDKAITSSSKKTLGGVQPRTSSSAVVVFPAPGGPWMRVSRLVTTATPTCERVCDGCLSINKYKYTYIYIDHIDRYNMCKKTSTMTECLQPDSASETPACIRQPARPLFESRCTPDKHCMSDLTRRPVSSTAGLESTGISLKSRAGK